VKSALALSFVAGVLALAGVFFEDGGRSAEAGSSDVTVQNVWWDPWDPVEGQQVNVYITIANLGESSTGDFWVDFYNHEESAPLPNQSGDAWCRITSMGPTSETNCDVTTTWVAAVPYTFWIQVDTEQEVWESDETNNISGPNWVYVQSADPDGDGILHPNDNCPNWPNPSQTLPAWSVGVPLTGTGPDSDCDSFSDNLEAYLGTDPTKQCAATGATNPPPPPGGSGLNDEPAPDRWPFDMNDGQNANTADVGQYVFSLNSFANQTPPDPRWNQRHDLTGNGVVNTADVGRYVFVLNRSCAPSGP
jgi:CARDB